MHAVIPRGLTSSCNANEVPVIPYPSRRAFLGNLATAAMGPVVLGRRAFAQNLPARVDAVALRQRIEALSVFGRPSGGSFADGVNRVAYSDADVAGRRYVIDLMRAAGLAPRVDPAGNIFGRRAGTDGALPPILFGSHIDSVPNGANFDGDLGSLAALGVVEALEAAHLRTRHPLEIVVWANVRLFCPRADAEGLTFIARSAATGELVGALLAEDSASAPPVELNQISTRVRPRSLTFSGSWRLNIAVAARCNRANRFISFSSESPLVSQGREWRSSSSPVVSRTACARGIGWPLLKQRMRPRSTCSEN